MDFLGEEDLLELCKKKFKKISEEYDFSSSFKVDKPLIFIFDSNIINNKGERTQKEGISYAPTWEGIKPNFAVLVGDIVIKPNSSRNDNVIFSSGARAFYFEGNHNFSKLVKVTIYDKEVRRDSFRGNLFVLEEFDDSLELNSKIDLF